MKLMELKMRMEMAGIPEQVLLGRGFAAIPAGFIIYPKIHTSGTIILDFL
jgi:hypothetical protein